MDDDYEAKAEADHWRDDYEAKQTIADAEREIERLRAALRRIADGECHDIDNPDLDYQAIARAALEPNDEP